MIVYRMHRRTRSFWRTTISLVVMGGQARRGILVQSFHIVNEFHISSHEFPPSRNTLTSVLLLLRSILKPFLNACGNRFRHVLYEMID